MTRGLKNNNPLNIRRGKTRWKGSLTPNPNSVANGDSLPFVGSQPHSVAALKPPVAPEERGEKKASPTGGGREGAFVRFESIEFGLRAAFVLLRTYSTKYKLNCIRDIVSRWAPPTENDTEQYIQNVCQWTGFGGNERLTEVQWPKLVQAMARQECGVVLDEDVIQRGFRLYKNVNVNLDLN